MMSPSLAVNALNSASLAEELARYRVVPADQLADLLDDFPGTTAAALAEFLVARRALNQFQADRALAGQTGVLALGPYRLIGPHRRSSLGLTFRAEKAGRARDGLFAIRVSPLRSLWQARQAKQLARAIAALPIHPAIVRLLDVDSANGYHYLVWPLRSGDLLADRIRAKGPLPPTDVAKMLAQLASGLVACHDRDVTHGLLSPVAVAMTTGTDESAAILDFGAGALLTQDLVAEESLFDTFSTANAFAGAIGYLAPEWIADTSHLTPAADQYSLGAVGYFALTGQPPTTPQLQSVADLNPAVPSELAAAIDQLLQFDPIDRFPTMEAAREVFAGLAGSKDLLDLLCPPSEAILPPRRLPSSASASGCVTWPNEPGLTRPPERDDSDDSIRFDLPEEPAQHHEAAAPGGPAAAAAPKEAALAADSGVWELFDLGTVPDSVPSYEVPERPRSAINEAPAPADPRTVPQETEPERPSKQPRPDHLPTSPRLLDLPTAPRESAAPPRLPAGPLPPSHRDMTPRAAARVLDLRVAPPRVEPPPQSVEAKRELRQRHEPVVPLWKSIRRKVLFWEVPTDTVRVSVFGPARTARSEAPRVTIYLHPPAAMESVETLARAFQHEAVLLGSSLINHPLARGAHLAIHLAVAHTAVTTPLGSCVWQGQPHRQTFDLVVPWEAPLGPATGIVSVGKDNVRIGVTVFQLPIEGEAG